MSKRTLGTCSICGGPVTVPLVLPVPPTPTCNHCGATPKQPHGATIEMQPHGATIEMQPRREARS